MIKRVLFPLMVLAIAVAVTMFFVNRMVSESDELATSPVPSDTENILVIDVTGQANGQVEIELLPDIAPQHVARVKQLARDGAYDNVVFHRVIDGFMAQTGDVEFGRLDGGDPDLAGTGGSALPDLPAEFSASSFDVGAMGMARSQDPHSANSQFFIMLAPAPHLNGGYTLLGRVVSGQEVVDAIKRGTGDGGKVTDPDVMVRVRVKADIEG